MRIKEILKLFLLIILLLFVSGCIKPPSPPPQQDTEKPVVNIISPQNGAELSGLVEIKIQATDNVGVKKITLYINGEEKGFANASTYTYSWDTTTVQNGSYTIKAKAEDTSGNIGEKSINVMVNNPIGPQPIFRDSFEGKTNNASQYTSPFYGETIPSTRNISFVDGKIGKGVYLYDLNSYVTYTTGYINPSEGTIKFYFKPEPNGYETYSYFLIDTVGWLPAFVGGFWVGIGVGTQNNNPISLLWAGVYAGTSEFASDWGWNYIKNCPVVLSNDFIEIAFAWSSYGGYIRLYVNGNKVGESVYTAPDNSGELFFLGHCPIANYWPYGTPRTMRGIYDELEIYNIDIYNID